MTKSHTPLTYLFSLLVGTLALGTLCALPKAAAAQTPPQFGDNLIVNGDAEAGEGSPDGNNLVDIPGWTREGNFQVVQYGGNGAASLTGPGPTDRGKNYFIGGPDNLASSASQTIDVSTLSPVLAKGASTFSFSAYLGGYERQEDHAFLLASFQDKAGRDLKTVTLGPVTAADRHYTTGLIRVAKTGPVPAGTQAIVIALKMVRTDGSYNDGSADNLSLIFNKKP